MVFGHIIVFAKEVNGFFGDLEVKVRVPRKYLWFICVNISHRLPEGDCVHFLIPPPAKKRTVHDPSLYAYVGHRVEEGLHECSKVVVSLVISDLPIREAAIVVRVKADRCQSVSAGQSGL